VVANRVRRAFGAGAVLAATGLLVISTGAGARDDATPQGKIVFSGVSGNGDLYTVHADGSHYRQLTDDPVPQQSPSWAPDGRSFVYVKATRSGSLYRMKATGGKPRLLYQEPSSANAIIQDPAWSPDGRRIAFNSARLGWTIWTYGLDGRLTEVTRSFSVHPTWSPDGRRIAYASLHGIGIVGLDGRRARDVPSTARLDENPVWSPDGKWIALRSLNPDWTKHEADSLDVVDPSGKVRRRLFTGSGALFPQAWSPTSDAVLVLRAVGTPPNTRSQLFIVPLGGGKPRPVDGTNGANGASWHR
jgi:Tol biopolymer transport system component